MNKIFHFSEFLVTSVPNYIKKINIKENVVCLETSLKYLYKLIKFLKLNHNCNLDQLVDICSIDYPGKAQRFILVYNLLSVRFNFRVRVSVKVDEITPAPTLVSLYSSANWLEREVWDMHGVFFNNHPDLRRILTDYGFEGFPLRKDFPQTGYVEVRYDDQKKNVLYEPLEMAQEYRTFDFFNPWKQVK